MTECRPMISLANSHHQGIIQVDEKKRRKGTSSGRFQIPDSNQDIRGESDPIKLMPTNKKKGASFCERNANGGSHSIGGGINGP